MMKKAQGSTIQILLGVVVVITIALAINYTRTQIIGQTMTTLTQTEETYRTDLTLKSLFNSKMPMGEDEEPVTKLKAASYACAYGEEHNYNIRLRPDSPRKNVNHTIERYLNSTVDGEYYFYIQCDSEHIIEIQSPPPEYVDIISASYEFPLPDGSLSTAYLYRWYE